jgi:hypothetical protein
MAPSPSLTEWSSTRMDEPPRTQRPQHHPEHTSGEQLGTPPDGSPPAWSVEHYGFEDGGGTSAALPGTDSTGPHLRRRTATPPVVRTMAAPSADRRPRRIRVVLGAAAVALVLTTGGAGFAVAQATGTRPDQAGAARLAGGVPGGGDHGPRTGFGPHR